MLYILKMFPTTLLLICCVFILRSGTIHPVFVSGYIDQMDPAVILIEELAVELILPNNKLPVESDAGMWVDLQVTSSDYIILQVNDRKTTTAKKRSQELREQLRERSLR